MQSLWLELVYIGRQMEGVHQGPSSEIYIARSGYRRLVIMTEHDGGFSEKLHFSLSTCRH
jgi:hypothetical protein